ncbi:MAG: hypothetical protein ACJA0U_001923 [Salibacteraceae bacterium]|jgi:hypothetical protein
MKKIIGIVAIFMALQTSAQERESVYSITKVIEEVSWYETQSKLWKETVDADNSNGEAWYNYYMAIRALRNLSEDPENRNSFEKKCTEIAKASYKAIPNSFAANKLMYFDQGVGKSDPKYLLKANEINPDDPRIFDPLFVYHKTNFDEVNAEVVAKKLLELDEFSTNLLNWGYNVLAELDENAIVFTAGDNDTYALWLVQDALGFRKDVTVINSYLVQLKDYRKRLTDKLGIEEFKETEELKDMFNHFIINSKKIPAYISMSALGSMNKEGVEDDLYLNGLTYKYSETNFDNSTVIRRNYENRYLLDYLNFDFTTGEHYKQANRGLNTIYLASMIKLYRMYQVGEEMEKAKELKLLIDKIAADSDNGEYVNNIMKGC